MKTFESEVKKLFTMFAIVGIIDFIVLRFAIITGLEHGFKLWNWLTIIIGVLAYVTFSVIVIIMAIRKDNKCRKKVAKEQLIANDFYVMEAQSILRSINLYLKDNQKVANDLRLYWPIYIGTLRGIAKGKKYNGDDYGIFEQLITWQKENYEDPFLSNVYDVLKNNVV